MAKKETEYEKEAKGILGGFFGQACSAVVTVANWTMAPNGETYMYFYCSGWKIVTDKMWPLDNFRSSEKWQLVATDENGNAVAFFPGCQIKAVVMNNKNPDKRAVYDFG